MCDLSRNLCCVSDLSNECAARANCATLAQLYCDGEEDCPDGQVCCQRDGSLVCADRASCAEEDRACHDDGDCAQNLCVEGIPGSFAGFPVMRYKGTGFCRGR